MQELESLKERFVGIRSNSKSSLTTKQNELMKLQHDFKKNYISSYEYKMLEILIQKYSDNLNKNTKSKSKRRKSLSASPFQQAGFGNTILDLNNKVKHNKIGNIQNIYEQIFDTDTDETIHNTVQINTKDYLYKETEYQYGYNPFIGSIYSNVICNRYLYKKHQQLTNTDKENRTQARIAKPLEIFYSSTNHRVEYSHGTLNFNDDHFENSILNHFKTMDNAFTMFIAGTSGHAIAIFLQKYNKKLYIYAVDSNEEAVDNVPEMIEALETYYEEKIGIMCNSIYTAKYSFNFGNSDEYEANGYCLLIAVLFIDIIYDNMVIYKNITYNSDPTKLLNYIDTMLNYLYDVFVKKKVWHTFVSNYAHKVFGEMGFFHENENKPVPSYFTQASFEDIFEYNPFEDKQYYSKDFNEKFMEFLMEQNLYCRIVGINWKSRNKNDVKKPQKDNNFEYFIPENLYSTVAKFFQFKSLTRDNFFLNIDNKFSQVTTEDHKHMFLDYSNISDEILFLFIDMEKYISHLNRVYPPISLNHSNADFCALIEEINTQLDVSQIPFIEHYKEYINSKNLYKIALIYKKRKIKITRFMSSILLGIMDKIPSHVRFWDNVENMTPESFRVKLKEFIENELHFTYKFTMINLGNDSYNGYWVNQNEHIEGVEPHDIDQAINYYTNRMIPQETVHKIMKILQNRHYTGNDNISSIFPFIKGLGSPSTKYNDRLFVSF